MAYLIRRGDTLSQLAARFNTSVRALANANGIKNVNLIYAGAQLRIPDGFDRGTTKPSRPSSPGTPSAPTSQTPGPGPAPSGPGAGVTQAQLLKIMPNLGAEKARQYLPFLNQAMAEQGITTEPRKEMFLAQLAHESGGLRYMEEIASGAAYEGRRDLGNTQPGDGKRFKGRGPIQLTGRANYREVGRALGLDLEGNPGLAASPAVGFRIAAYFWKSRGLNSLADQGNFREVTRRINGGYNGLADREMYWARARAAI
jgi:predicted chitinase